MADMQLIQGAITGLMVAADIAKGFLELRTIAEVQGKVIELQSAILSTQSSVLAAHSEQLAMIQRVGDLEKEVAHVKAWNETKQRYELKEISAGVFAYSLKKEGSPTEPPHWICQKCYEDGVACIIPFQYRRGWKPGSQVTIAALNAEGSYDRLPVLAEALAKKNPAVIVATTTRVVAVPAKAAPRTPVVMLIVADPVASGFAASLARPGGMLTGISNASADTVVKFVELLVTAKPGLRQIGFLSAVSAVSRPRMLDSIRRSAAQYSVEVSIAEVKQRDEIDPALSQLAKQGMQALAIVPAPLPTVARKEILQFAAGQRWPVIAISRQWVDDGALLSYGADNESQFRRAAYFVDRILRGAKPADLPIELPTTFEMAVNLKTAKALGLTMPPEIMVRATRVIE